MSAIWGIVDLNKNSINDKEIEMLKCEYLSKKIDRIDEFQGEFFYLACGIQYVNSDAMKEHFPYVLNENKYMVADVIIDNREELEGYEDAADGKIMFDALNKDFDDALDKMLGAYAFAYFDAKKCELNLVSDAVGNRSVYYYVHDGIIYFSTILNPIINIINKPRINEGWFRRYADTHDLRVVLESTETPIEDVFRVEPGEKVTISSEGVEKCAYWNPFLNRKDLKLKNYSDYKKIVLDTYQKCVESVIREGKETGILLSGGLDSNSVAAYAAPYLKKKDRKLYSFTSVPIGHSEQIVQGQYGVENETFYIKELEKKHDNLCADYIYTGNDDVIEANRRIFKMMGYPYKTITNIPWMLEAYKRAGESGCGVILSGQYGNITISYGDFETLFTTLLLKGKIKSFVHEINAFSRRYKYSRKKIIKDLLHPDRERTLDFIRKYMYDKPALRQISEAETVFSLESGVIHRDPTRDKRLIELVLRLPIKVFVREGRARLLVRDYMKELIPDSIAQDEFHKGRQGVGDNEYIEKNWNNIIPILVDAYKSDSISAIWDEDELKQKIRNIDVKEDTFGITELIYTALACEYMGGINAR